tara:strand:- start:891 stop:1271 length:381 start_codon:yes stop_codon:yes gene_type:complete
MKQVLLDTNFIITCLKEKIDFVEDLTFMGFQLLVPKQVIIELTKISEDKQKQKKLHHRQDAVLALKLIAKSQLKKVDIGKGPVDNQIKKYIKEHPKTFIATLDRGLLEDVLNRKITIRRKNKLEII